MSAGAGPAPISVRAQQPRSLLFRRQREQEWHELEVLVSIALKGGLRKLPEPSVTRLLVLYRAALSSLAVARRTAMDRQLVGYLEALATRAFLVVHGARRPAQAALGQLFAGDFPRAVRSMARELLLAATLFGLGVAVAWSLTARDSSWFYAFVDESMASGRTPNATTESLRATLYGGASGWLGVFASFLFTHNARIGMLAFAAGIAAGVPSALLLFINGLSLGAFLALFDGRGLLVPLLGWLLPHGVPEITAMLLCGAAGLCLGRAMVAPGSRTALSALAEAGRRAAVVVAASVLLFAIAGVFEGVLRQWVVDDRVRLSLAAVNALWLGAWLARGGRGRSSA